MPPKAPDLHSSLWAGANEFRRGVNAGLYTNQVLTLLSRKHLPDTAKADPAPDVEVADRGSFDDLTALHNETYIGDQTDTSIRNPTDRLRTVIYIADGVREAPLSAEEWA